MSNISKTNICTLQSELVNKNSNKNKNENNNNENNQCKSTLNSITGPALANLADSDLFSPQSDNVLDLSSNENAKFVELKIYADENDVPNKKATRAKKKCESSQTDLNAINEKTSGCHKSNFLNANITNLETFLALTSTLASSSASSSSSPPPPNSDDDEKYSPNQICLEDDNATGNRTVISSSSSATYFAERLAAKNSLLHLNHSQQELLLPLKPLNSVCYSNKADTNMLENDSSLSFSKTLAANKAPNKSKPSKPKLEKKRTIDDCSSQDTASSLISTNSLSNSIRTVKSVLINYENDIITNKENLLPIIKDYYSKNEENVNSITNTIVDTAANCSSTSSIVSVPVMKESPPLKRSHAITDIHQMDDFSPVTFETCQSIKSEEAESVSAVAAAVASIADEDQSKLDYIEEKKCILIGVKVRAAKVSKLVEILIESFDESGQVLSDTDFPRVFLLMHKWFMESEILTNMLYDLCVEKIDKQINLNENEHFSNYLLKICHTFRYWIQKFPFHFVLDTNLIEAIKRFSNMIIIRGHEEKLKFFDISNIESYDWMRKLTTRNPLKSKEKVSLAIHKLDPYFLAGQITYLEWKTVRRISFSDYKAYSTRGAFNDNQALAVSFQLSNGLTRWVIGMILNKPTPKQRADVMHRFIEVAKHLRQLQNFNSLMAVMGGICHSTILRLSKTILYLSNEDQKIINEYNELLSSNCNYGQYRKTTSEIQSFWMPIICIHLKDIISLHTAHLDILENDLINFRKMAQLSVIFQSITDLQNSVPPEPESRDIIKILQVLFDMYMKNYTDDELYELSLEREPRTSVSSPSTPSKISSVFADFAKTMSAPPDPLTIQKHVTDMVNVIFKNYDYDRDGFISQEEFDEISQSFPFIITFAVLDTDKNGMISREEMKNYFLKVNYHALKTEFKHDFDEHTYLKPTFCAHCKGFLWGLIKQGYRCRDCGINAHRDCKEIIVIECRSKRNHSFSRQASANADTNTQPSNSTINSSTNTISRRVRSISTRSPIRAYQQQRQLQQQQPKVKQKSTQTENFDDIFLSDDDYDDESEDYSNYDGSDNEYHDDDDEEQSSADDERHHHNHNHHHHRQIRHSSNRKSNPHSAKNNRQNFYYNNKTIDETNNENHRCKKSPKRRKSLPSSGSIKNEEPHVPALIPRGPLICYNSENPESWLAERLFSINNANANPNPNPNSSTPTTNNSTNILHNPASSISVSESNKVNEKTQTSALNTVESSPSLEKNSLQINKNIASTIHSSFSNASEALNYKQATTTPKLAIPNQMNNKNTSTSLSSSLSPIPSPLYTKKDNNEKLFVASSNLTLNNNSSSVSSDLSEKVAHNRNTNTNTRPLFSTISTSTGTNMNITSHRVKLIPRPIQTTIILKPSKLELNMQRQANASKSTSIADSNSNGNLEEDCDVFLRLKEAEKVKEKLERENAKIKQELESANAQISSLKEKMSIIKPNANKNIHDDINSSNNEIFVLENKLNDSLNLNNSKQNESDV